MSLPELFSKPVVIYFDPVSIGILEINLFHPVRSKLGVFTGLGPVSIFYVEGVEMFCEIFHGRHAKGEATWSGAWKS